MERIALTYIDARRLRLVPGTAALVSLDLESREALAETLEIDVPENWPPDLYDRRAMEEALQRLGNRNERGWSLWYVQTRPPEAEQLVGICGFKGRPDADGSVEISYAMLPQFRGRGFATEAAHRLITWAFSHPGVTEVTAETLPTLKSSIRVLEKAGFEPVGRGSERGVLRYRLARSPLR